MKVLLSYCKETGVLTDAEGIKIQWKENDIPVSFGGSSRALMPDEYCALLGVGLNKEDILDLLKEGVIG